MLHGQPPSWWTGSGVEQAVASLVLFAVTCCLLTAVVMVARAASWGRLRQRCWRYPPRWLALAAGDAEPNGHEIVAPG